MPASNELCAAVTGSVALARLGTRVAAAVDDSWPRVLRAQPPRALR